MGSRTKRTIAPRWMLLTGCLFFSGTFLVWGSTGDISTASLATDYSASAATKSLGTSGVASSRGIDGLYDNPAGLARITEYEVGLSYVGLFEGTYYSYLGYLNPLLGRGSVGMGWARITSFGFNATDRTGNPLGGFNDAQNVFYLGYGYPLRPDLQVGANLKCYYQDLYQYHSLGFGLDLGLQYQWLQELVLGINLQNPVAIPIRSDQTQEPLPARIRTGFSWSPDASVEWLDPLTAHLEFDWEDLGGLEGGILKHGDSWKLGLEYDVQGIMNISAGLRSQNLTVGASFDIDPVTVAYAYDVHALGGLHWVSLQFRVGRQAVTETVNHHAGLALQAYELKKYRASLQEWERVLEIEPDNVAAARYRDRTRQELAAELALRLREAETAIAADDLKTALGALQEAEGMDPESSDILRRRTEVEAALQERARLEVLARVNEHRERARNHYRRNQWTQALKEWEAVARLVPDDPEALNEIRTLKSEMSTMTDLFFSQGVGLFEERKYTEARQRFEAIVTIDPEYDLAVFYLAKVKQALAVELRSKYREAIRAVRKHEYPLGIRLFEEILRGDPNYRDVEMRLRSATAGMAEWQNALVLYRQARAEMAQADPGRVLAILTPLVEKGLYDDRMHSLYVKAKETQASATRFFEEGLRQYDQNDIEGAIARFGRSVGLDRKSPAAGLLVEAYLRKGVLAYRRGDLSGALAAWQKVLTLQSDHRMAKLYLQRVRFKMNFIREWQRKGK